MFGKPGMGDDRAVAQRARPPFHSSLKPSDDVACGDLFGDRIQQRLALQLAITQACAS